MLVLNRKVGETVVIGQTTITVLDISGTRVKLGFLAPDDLRILRGELLEEPEGDE